MKVSIYSTCWGLEQREFDVEGALDNWAVYADEISIAVGDGYSAERINDHVGGRGYPVVLTHTSFDFASDPFAYGKTENAALQACTGDLLIQQNLDERLLVRPARLAELNAILQRDPSVSAFFVPTIDLYGSHQTYLKIGRKWYVHGRGLYRGSLQSAIKADGRPDYNKTSTDELLTVVGGLASTASLLNDLSIEAVRRYVEDGWPISFHLGYVDFAERLDRSVWWKSYWERATGGDQNTHPTTIAEMAAKETREHGLPLWPTARVLDDQPL